jgi:hypothetical protein
MNCGRMAMFNLNGKLQVTMFYRSRYWKLHTARSMSAAKGFMGALPQTEIMFRPG